MLVAMRFCVDQLKILRRLLRNRDLEREILNSLLVDTYTAIRTVKFSSQSLFRFSGDSAFGGN